MNVGIYGGSFNPIHFGHIGLAKWVVENTDLDELWLMVSPNNPLKDKNILVNFSGHVHSGDHERILYPTLGCDTVFYNVSIKNEQYRVAFQPRYILLNKEDKTVIEMGTTKMITLD